MTMWELGYKRGIGSELLVSVTFFRKNIQNQIDAKTLVPFDSKYSGSYGFASYVNLGEAHASGIEILLSRQSESAVRSTISYSYMAAEGVGDRSDANISLAEWGFAAAAVPSPLSWDQRHTVKADLQISLPFEIGLNIVGLYHSPRPYTYYPTRDGIHPEDPSRVFVPNNARMSNVFVVDMKATKQWNIGPEPFQRIIVFVDARNIFNRRNILWVDSNGRPGGIPGDPSAYDMPRRVRVGVEVNF
jgi:outer membrane receptor protein involved in Fe transport